MADKTELQHVRSSNDFALVQSEVRKDLIARARKDATRILDIKPGADTADQWLKKGLEVFQHDKHKALECFLHGIALDPNHAELQFALGVAYTSGLNWPVNSDEEKAVHWWRKAASQGHARAQCNLGCMYENGHGGVCDRFQAHIYFRHSAEQNYAAGQYFLGRSYEYGIGINEDYVQAAIYYRKAAGQGFRLAEQALNRIQRERSKVLNNAPKHIL